ncbi:unnamed protein product [Eruca vesicaria subsp. sativa]|uniref:At2g35280-like TPR domain-containing protein n=1 Tax=Eruca vesicaria subsp. sativa TaxID=29727 RepID=A0ABC8JK80_ERUVS|nr:unnamed protein product [Eruca vesicaria subsp. sativa]
MQRRTRTLAQIELLPTELQQEIMSRDAKFSIDALHNLIIASPTLADVAADPHVYKNINLHTLTVFPLTTLTIYKDLMERCLNAGNVQAHYIRGLQEYFHHNNIAAGLPHIKIAAEGLYDNTIYLYALIMMCSGQQEIGRTMLDSLGWRTNKKRADTCWRNIKKSLHGVQVITLDTTTDAYREAREPITCHRYQMRVRCEHCYYYKQIYKFTFTV